MLQFSQFVWPLSYSIWDIFNNFLLIDATHRSKISSDQKRFFIALSLYPLSFFANTPFNGVIKRNPRMRNCIRRKGIMVHQQVKTANSESVTIRGKDSNATRNIYSAQFRLETPTPNSSFNQFHTELPSRRKSNLGGITSSTLWSRSFSSFDFKQV